MVVRGVLIGKSYVSRHFYWINELKILEMNDLEQALILILITVGESSGRASRTVAKHIPGPNEALRERVSSATGEINMAHQMVLERGEKLSQLEERTARMMSEAENFSTSAHGLMLKYKDKKWYQL